MFTARQYGLHAGPLPGASWIGWLGVWPLPLPMVVRIVRAARVTRLPGAPPVILGAIDIAGDILPVFNMRQRLGLPDRSLAPADQLLIARTQHRTVVLWIDVAVGVLDRTSESIIDPAALSPELGATRGILRLGGGLALIQDLEQFLSPEEGDTLDAALKRARGADAG